MLPREQFRERSLSVPSSSASHSLTIIHYLDRIERRLDALSSEIRTVRDDLQLIRQHFLHQS